MTGEGGWEVATSVARLRQRPDAGMATAELAVGMVSLLLVLALVLTGLRAGMDRAGAISVAGLLAREAAHSGPAAAGDLWTELRPRLPSGSSMTVESLPGLVQVRVHVPVRSGLAAVVLPDSVTAEAVARDERP